MTRIGFAYNEKPAPSAPQSIAQESEGHRPEEEPPSRRRDSESRNEAALMHQGGQSIASPAATVADAPADEFAEWDSPETIAAVERALAACGTVIRLEANADFPERLRAERPDIVFNIAEGLHGVNREAHVPAICEFFGIPYSGSDPFTLSLCLDKARTKETLAFHGVPTAPFFVIRDVEALRAFMRDGGRGKGDELPAGMLRGGTAAAGVPLPPSPFPLFAKPLHEGSSKGITERNYCRTARELEETVAFLLETYAQPVLVETYLPGQEFTCAVLGNGRTARVLPIVGMNFASLPEGALPIYGYEAKWIWDRPENPLEMFECPARVGDALTAAIERVTLDAYRVLGCRDWSRIDVRLDAAGVPNVVEVNPLPGILPNPEDNSCFPKAARAAGLSYDELIQSCLRLAAERQGVALGSPNLTGTARGTPVYPAAHESGAHAAGAATPRGSFSSRPAR
jgi:D-alanine-D-alanine ligase